MKVTYHIPIEQYGFIELEDEDSWQRDVTQSMSYEKAKALFMPPVEPKTAPRSDVELTDKEFNVKLDKYLAENVLGSHEYESCTPLQKIVLQCIKRSIKRMELEGRKATDEEIEEVGDLEH